MAGSWRLRCCGRKRLGQLNWGAGTANSCVRACGVLVRTADTFSSPSANNKEGGAVPETATVLYTSVSDTTSARQSLAIQPNLGRRDRRGCDARERYAPVVSTPLLRCNRIRYLVGSMLNSLSKWKSSQHSASPRGFGKASCFRWTQPRFRGDTTSQRTDAAQPFSNRWRVGARRHGSRLMGVRQSSWARSGAEGAARLFRRGPLAAQAGISVAP